MKIEEEATTESGKRDSLPPSVSTSGTERSSENWQSRETPQRSKTLSRSSSKGPSEAIDSSFVGSNSQVIRRQICFCNNAPSSSQQSSPLPHMRDAYCSETTKKLTRNPKPQSIFTDTSISSMKSSVVVEEIPNDVCEESTKNAESPRSKCTAPEIRDSGVVPMNFGAGDNEWMTKKRATIIEEIPNTGPAEEIAEPLKPMSVDGQTKELPARKGPNFGTGDNGTNNSSSVGVVTNGPSMKKDSPKLESANDGKFDQIKSPYEFLRLWQSLKNDPELILHGRLLKALAPEDLDAGELFD